IQNARIQEKVAQLSTNQLKLSLEADLLAFYDLYVLRVQLITMAQARLRAAELNLDLANERYRNGSISAIDLRIIQESNLTAALDNFDAIFAALQARTDLTRLIGGFVGDNVTGDN
ncbi:MAG: TolC family protein, partial [Bacteroidia bacterium]|nr:TolC family protein [Bacteroidia bacterium]